MCIDSISLSAFTGYERWSDIIPSSYSSLIEGVYIGRYSTNTIDLLRLVFPASECNGGVMYVEREGNDTLLCGWSDLPCRLIKHAFSLNPSSLKELKLLYSSSAHEAESEGIAFIRRESIIIEGVKGGEEISETVEKEVTDSNAILFTFKCLRPNIPN